MNRFKHVFIFILLLLPLFVIAQEKNQNENELNVANDSLATISGTVVCITEELAKIRNIEPNCEKYGCLFGLKTPDHTIWSFHRNPVGIELREKEKYRGKKIKIIGKVFYNAKVIEVHDFKILSNEKLKNQN